MTEVAKLPPSDHHVASVKHYEAGPPPGLELVEPGETFAKTKEEEWISKKKKEITNTKQIETRVKRQVVLEDGKVVDDSGPLVSTNTTEDTETQEHTQTELRKIGDDEENDQKAIEDKTSGPKDALALEDKSKWVPIANPEGIVREVKQTKVISREEIERVKETEDVQHLGDISDEQYLKAVSSGKEDLRPVLRSLDKGRTVVSKGPKLVHESYKTNKVTDTEQTRELSSALPDGKIVTETQRTTEHEEVKDEELPENVPAKNTLVENSQRYVKTREQEDVDYVADGVKVGHEMRYRTETVEAEKRGDGGFDETDWDSLSARARRRQANGRAPHRYRGVENGTAAANPFDRTDALTKKPLDFDLEEETRKVETSKWLENHFGSESRSSNNSVDDIDEVREEQPPKTSYFNVTIKSTVNSQNQQQHKSQNQKYFGQVEPERDVRPSGGGFYHGVSEWSERKQTQEVGSRKSPTSPVSPQRDYVQTARKEYSFQNPTQKDYAAQKEKMHEELLQKSQRNRQLQKDLLQTAETNYHYYNRDVREKGSQFRRDLESTLQKDSKDAVYGKDNSYAKDAKESYQKDVSDLYSQVIRSPKPPQNGFAKPPNGFTQPANGFPQSANGFHQPPNGFHQSPNGFQQSPSGFSQSPNGFHQSPNGFSQSPNGLYSKRDYQNGYHSQKDINVIHQREYQRSPAPDYNRSSPRAGSPYRVRESSPRIMDSPSRIIDSNQRIIDSNQRLLDSSQRMLDSATPTPPQRKKAMERRQRSSQDSRFDSGYRTPSRNETRDEPMEEPPPDYSPPSPPPMPQPQDMPPSGGGSRKQQQKTRFAVDSSPPKQKSGNIIGQSIRKLVGKIRSASAERKARQRAKRSPSPSYQKGHVIDGNISHRDQENTSSIMRPSRRGSSPVHRYYLGEDPFGGSIYGRENKYEGVVKPSRSANTNSGIRRHYDDNEHRSQSTLGRFSKSTGRLPSHHPPDRTSQTLPRHSTARHEQPTRLEKNNRSNSTINVSIINTVSTPPRAPVANGGPAKPARTYKSNLSRSKSFNVHGLDYDRNNMHKSNPHLHRLDASPIGLKSPGLISSISRSQRDLSQQDERAEEHQYTSRFVKNGHGDISDSGVGGSSRRVFLKGLKDRAPELYKTLHENEDDWRGGPANAYATSTPLKERSPYNGDMYEPPTRLRDTHHSMTSPLTKHVMRRGSNSSNDYSETYHTTTRNDDPVRPSVTDTVKTFSKKTVPAKDGKTMQTIESTETKSVTKSRFVGESPPTRYYDSDRKYVTHQTGKPVVIEVRNNYRK